MRLSFRAKLILVVWMAAFALLALIGGSALSAGRTTTALDLVERRLLPMSELAPRLKEEFAELQRAFQDAVAAQDRSALDSTLARKIRLLELITARQATLGDKEGTALRWAIQSYYDAALSVSKQLIAGEAHEALIEEIAFMQERQTRAEKLIGATASLGREELSRAFTSVRVAHRGANQFRLVLGIGALVTILGSSFWMSRGLLKGVQNISDGFARFATGSFKEPIPVTGADELTAVALEANRMAAGLRQAAETRETDDWIIAGRTALEDAIRGELARDGVALRGLTCVAERISAVSAALYVVDRPGVLVQCATYAAREGASSASGTTPVFRVGQGLIGEAVRRTQVWIVREPPAGYLKVRSALGDADPRALVLVPLHHRGEAVGVAEFALFEPCSESVQAFLASTQVVLAMALSAANSRNALEQLLIEAQRQAERLSAQEEELRVNNQELQAQQEELRLANEELVEQRRALGEKNQELEEARARIQQKADELAQVSSYKSQFLANMSHELRTPLNSMLVLSELLAENEAGNLTERQVEHCKTVYAAAQDLLALINQILDLAKIEAGRQELDLEEVPLEEFASYARRMFEGPAGKKKLALKVQVDPTAPRAIVTDRLRLERILTNLIGNAIKFTDRGSVSLRIGPAAPELLRDGGARVPPDAIAFTVSDTGIGIASEDQERVFRLFEQVEAKSDRRFAGTGLGLAIARESAWLLGGEILLESVPGAGSTFTCCVPRNAPAQSGVRRSPSTAPSSAFLDDRRGIRAGDPHLLLIEDDPVIVECLAEIVHGRQFKLIVASSGEEGLRLAQEFLPTGVILDVKLPDIDGWTVIERLRANPSTSLIPVHFMSAMHAPEKGFALGAVGYLTKPATRIELANMVRVLTSVQARDSLPVLIVEDSAIQSDSLLTMLSMEGIWAKHVGTASAALSALEAERFACMVLDLGLPDMSGLDLLETLRGRADVEMPRVIVHTARALSKQETRKLEEYVQAVVLKDGSSKERLLEEVRLFIGHLRDKAGNHAVVGGEPGPVDSTLAGTKILIAEDDMRTVYALSAVLRGKGADVLVAETGAAALALLAVTPDVDAVLMDIMMPEMDGYEAMRRLRADPRFAKLPVIALTAKALKGERERCLEAGASDYLSKPVEGARLLSTLHHWLRRGKHATVG